MKKGNPSCIQFDPVLTQAAAALTPLQTSLGILCH
jgi:hypothetical protein